MTSNVGTKVVKDFGNGIGFATKNKSENKDQEVKDTLEKELKKKFAPEFINRLDEIIVFNTLNDEDVKKIVMVEINKLVKRLTGLKLNVSFDQSVIDFVSKVGFDEVYGARPLKRAIQEKLEDYISDEVLKGNIKEEKLYTIKIEEENVICEEQITEKKTKTRKKKGE